MAVPIGKIESVSRGTSRNEKDDPLRSDARAWIVMDVGVFGQWQFRIPR